MEVLERYRQVSGLQEKLSLRNVKDPGSAEDYAFHFCSCLLISELLFFSENVLLQQLGSSPFTVSLFNLHQVYLDIGMREIPLSVLFRIVNDCLSILAK